MGRGKGPKLHSHVTVFRWDVLLMGCNQSIPRDSNEANDNGRPAAMLNDTTKTSKYMAAMTSGGKEVFSHMYDV